MLCRGLKK
uniref:Uncharacterized protein n=1 Tax=Arundo donax TaxID=35708 RepID=A0A0A9FDS8_ARUDO